MFLDQIRAGHPVTLTVPSMTRFLLSLEQAVDTVLEAIKDALPGEIIVPNAASATVQSIADALIGDRGTPTEVIGIRPGEKMHEIMVSEEESFHTVAHGDYYAILPMLPELRNEKRATVATLDKEFSSADRVMDTQATRALLASHRLLVEGRDLSDAGELLR
jgi:UDP-glucose 4-epimerase